MFYRNNSILTRKYHIKFSKLQCLIVCIGVYWQIKRIQVSQDEIKKEDKFDNMIKAIKSREAMSNYSRVLWEVNSKCTHGIPKKVSDSAR